MQEISDLEQMVLDHVERTEYQPVKAKVIAKQLELPEERRRELRKAIKRLVKQGRLQYGDRHLVRRGAGAAAKKEGLAQQRGAGKSTVTGVFRRAAAGYGFVRPSNTARSVGRLEDIYIPQRRTLDASTGDLVAVRLRKPKPQRSGDGGENRKNGEIVEILERDTHQFVGTYFSRADAGYVKVDGNVFSQPIYVGDAGAKNARGADKVVIEMVRFPSNQSAGEGVIVEVLGARGAPGVDTLSVIREYQLPEEFSKDVLDVARAEADKFDESIGDRLDLTGATVITIDPQDARDFDDAISLERIENDHWRLGVHIADVVNFVKPGTALDDEARQRATSVYLPDRVLPMLPEIISNNLASLQPDRVRYTKTAFIEFTPDGARVATEVHSAAIKSDRRFTYEEVDEYLDNPKPWKKKLTPEVFALLARMHELAMILRKRRLDGGAIELTLPEIKIDLDAEGKVCGAHAVEHTVSHQIIEEFMLAANEAVAEHLRDRKIDFLRRVHDSPMRKKLADLTSFVSDLGISCDSLEDRFEIKRVVAAVADRPERHAVNYAVLRSMQKAVYSPDDQGHYALASDCYCHFTSPIRRYPDLTVHRIFDALLAGKKPRDSFEQLEVLGEHCSQREQRAEAAERDLIKVKLLHFLSQKVGEQLEAVITGVEEYGLFAQGTQLPAGGLIHVSSLQDDYYEYDAKSHSLTGRRAGNSFRLGDLVRIEIAHVDIDGRQLDFRIVAGTTHRGRPPKKKKKAAGKRGKPAKKSRRKG